MGPKKSTANKRRVTARRVRRWVKNSAQNALELARFGRLGEASQAPFVVESRDRVFRLRRYPSAPDVAALDAPLVLVPPLMVTAEVYDVSPERSAVRLLARSGIEPWVVDFGAPEREEGGMQRTLDDHVRAVSRAIDRVRELTGRPVHLAGYSQGGLFAYQAAAYRRSEGIASLVTFGSPVDIHRNVRVLGSETAALVIRAMRPIVARQLNRIEGLPGELTSAGFKLLTPHKEIEQLVDFVRKLHDRKALERRESRRRFLGGEGFVAWPAPALRAFFEEFVVHNRMVSGGFVIDGRTVTLADITCPVLAFIGSRDDLARPAAVRAIATAAPEAEVFEHAIEAGHFGLVVGERAMTETWPTVVEWLRWRENLGGKPARLVSAAAVDARSTLRSPADQGTHDFDDEPAEAAFDVDVDVDLVLGAAGAIGDELRRVGHWVQDAADHLRALRWQVPRLRLLERIEPSERWSLGLVLAEQAEARPGRTFFLWQGRAVTYGEANARVDRVVRGLVSCGVRRGERVAIVMRGRPSLLSVVTALSRLGNAAVIIPPSLRANELASALSRSGASHVVCDPESAEGARGAFHREVLVLGGGGHARDLGTGLVDMEAINHAEVALPVGFEANPMRANDLALVFYAPNAAGGKFAPVTNHRLALSALGAAAACTLSPDDTVYCCLPIYHPAGLMVAVMGALVGGSRLALAKQFDATEFWREVRRYGASVVFYAGEMLRPLVGAAPHLHDKHHPVRLFAGSGMRVDLWRELVERFGASVLEFYAATSRNIVLANASGEKIGALGRPMPGSAELAVVRIDLDTGEIVRGEDGFAVRARAGEPGLSVGRLSSDNPEPIERSGERVHESLFEAGDRWFSSGDILRRDRDGDYWFVDRLTNMVRTKDGRVSCRRVEDGLYAMPEVVLAAAYGVPGPTSEEVVADVVVRRTLDAAALTAALAELAPYERPRSVRQVETIPMTEGFQPDKAALRARASRGTLPSKHLRYAADASVYLEAPSQLDMSTP